MPTIFSISQNTYILHNLHHIEDFFKNCQETRPVTLKILKKILYKDHKISEQEVHKRHGQLR